MKNLNIRALFFSVLATLSCYIGCVRPDPETPDTYAKYPIDVKADELPDGSFRLRWNAIKSADFIEYQVLKNTGDTVPFIENNTTKLGKVEIAKRIEDIDSTFFIDSFSVPTKRTFLRVFAVLKNRNLSSKNVEMPVKSDAKEMEINANDVVYVPEDKRLLIADQVKFKFGVFSTERNQEESINGNIIFSANSEMCYGKYNGSTEVYAPNNFQITLRNILSNASFNFGNFTSFDAVLYDNSANMVIAMSAFPPTIHAFRRSAISSSSSNSGLLSSTRFPTPPKTQALYVLRPARLNREVLAVSITSNNSDVIWFRYDPQGISATKISSLNTLTLNITKRPFSVAPDNQGFITSGKGLIFNRNMTLVDSLKLPEPQVRYSDMIFSNDGTHLYCLRLGLERHERVVDSYSYPNYRFERSLPFKSTPLRIFQEDNKLILIGRSPNSPLFTMIEKLNL